VFKLEKEVPKLKYCQELKELGYPQEGGGFYWIKFPHREDWITDYISQEVYKNYKNYGNIKIIKAPTCREMEEWLVQDFYGCFFHTAKWKDTWFVYYMDKRGDLWFPNLSKAEVEGKNEPDARAKMLIWLVKNKHISFKKEGNA